MVEQPNLDLLVKHVFENAGFEVSDSLSNGKSYGDFICRSLQNPDALYRVVFVPGDAPAPGAPAILPILNSCRKHGISQLQIISLNAFSSELVELSEKCPDLCLIDRAAFEAGLATLSPEGEEKSAPADSSPDKKPEQEPLLPSIIAAVTARFSGKLPRFRK